MQNSINKNDQRALIQIAKRTVEQAYFGGGGLVRAHTTDLQWPVLCQLCPGLQPPAGWEIPRERMATVGLIPFHLQRKPREAIYE